MTSPLTPDPEPRPEGTSWEQRARRLMALLEEEKARLDAVQSVAKIGSWETDLATFEVRWSQETHRIFETDSAAFRPTHPSFLERVHPDDRERVDAAFLSSLNGGASHSIEHRILAPDGRVKRVEERWRSFSDASGRFVKAVGTCQDVTESRLTEARLRESEEKFSKLFVSSPAKMAIGTMDGRLVDVNRAYADFFGFSREEMLGRSIAELGIVSREELERLLALGGELGPAMHDEEVVMRARDGRALHVLMSADVVTIGGVPHRIASLIDVGPMRQAEAARRDMEARALRAQRLEALGTLAGGIAHDLNNSLSPIMMSLLMLRERIREPDLADLLHALDENVHRAADMVRQVLLFARGVDGRRVPLDPASVAREVAKIVGDTFPKSISCDLDAAPGLGAVLGDATQLHQVLLNLCLNARDAMPSGGKLTLRLDGVALTERDADLVPGGRPGAFVRIVVSDTGTGIPAEICENIFEPFFTTKEVGRGTGLGLSTTQAIVRSHGGFIAVDSELGAGSRFSVYLPATEEGAAAAGGERPQPPRGKGELVLVVDDESSIRGVARRILEAAGYRVLLAADGREAVAVFTRHRDAVSAVVTDMSMPLMGGRALIAALRALAPGLPVVGTSGMLEGSEFSAPVEAERVFFLHKPYVGDALLRVLRAAIDSSSARPGK